MTHYVLKAQTEKETLYYMNIICITEQVDCAEQFATLEEAEKHKDYFAFMFHHTTPVITVEKIED